jgi:hypothetical protein
MRPRHAERSSSAEDQLLLRITITMYWRERDHPIPHFHAEQAGHRASIAIDGTVPAGELPARALRFVREWTALHRDELQANWERARNAEPLERIEPPP